MGKGTAGNLSKVMILGAIIGGISEHNVKRSTKEADDSEYVSSPPAWDKFLPVGLSAEGSFKGKMRDGDAGQAALLDAWQSQTLIGDAKFYFGPNVYDTPDLVADADAGMLIKDLDFGNNMNGVVTVSVSYKFSGPVKRVTV